MDVLRVPWVRGISIAGVGGLAVGMGSGACVVDDLPCPAHCFEYTVEYEGPKNCQTGEGENILISFTGTDPAGYHGRYCFNSPSVPLVVEAIDHLHSGGALSELDPEVANAYVATVDAVKANVQSECVTAAPGQCTNADEVCTIVGSDLYEQLVVEQTCVLEPAGIEQIQLGPDQVCTYIPIGDDTGPAQTGEPCDGTTGGSGEGADTTGAGDGVGDQADETTGTMVGPFGDVEALVSCNSTHCTVDRELWTNVSTQFGVFYQEGVTLAMVDGEAPCGPGARLGGLSERDHAKALADALGLRNGDVIAQIETIGLSTVDDVMAAVASLLEDPSTTMVVRRTQGPSCQTLIYDIDVL